nr:reverse transcriptase domain-containing protein [Tanacetum cinerariifolium]
MCEKGHNQSRSNKKQGEKNIFKKRGDFKNQQRSERRRDTFTLLTKSPREILALDKGKFKTPPQMTTPIKKRNSSKLCEFHTEVGYNTDECMHLKRQIEELIKAGKLSHVIKELKQNRRKDQPKAAKKGEASGKDKPLENLMVEPWKMVARQRITQSFSPNPKILFPPLGDEDEIEGPMIIKADIGAEHCLNVREGCLPVRQKKRSQAPERNKAIQEEVGKLVDAGIMKEVHYHSWLSNPVMVKKHDDS